MGKRDSIVDGTVDFGFVSVYQGFTLYVTVKTYYRQSETIGTYQGKLAFFRYEADTM
jgi:hypothetical protein